MDIWEVLLIRLSNRWETMFIVVFICISFMISEVEHLFMYLLATYIYISRKISIQTLFPFFSWIV